ncbi:MAG: translation initiation factor IF-6 [Candidatus Njordarchaeales archaeon]
MDKEKSRQTFASIDYRGNWNIGAYGLATDKFAIFGEGFRPKILEQAKEVLNVPIYIVNIMDEPIVGILLASNSNGVLVPPQVSDEEIKLLRSLLDVPVERLSFRTYENALGNILLVNDKAALIHEDIMSKNKHAKKIIEDVLDVEVVSYKFSFVTIGSVVGANNRGALAHPLMTDDELRFISETLKVRVGKGTVNLGSPYIRSGMILNSFGFLVGLKTTGLEMHRAYEILLREE